MENDTLWICAPSWRKEPKMRRQLLELLEGKRCLFWVFVSWTLQQRLQKMDLQMDKWMDILHISPKEGGEEIRGGNGQHLGIKWAQW